MFTNLKKQIESGNGPGPASVIMPKTASMSAISTSTAGMAAKGPTSTAATASNASTAGLDVRIASSASSAELHRKPPLAVKTVTEASVAKMDGQMDGHVAQTAISPDANEMSKLRARNDSLEQAYESYRTKTADLLVKKDSHISRLQERVANLERRLDDRSDTATQAANLRSERDELATKLAQLEETVEAERRDLKAASARLIAEHEKKLRELALDHQTQLHEARSSSSAARSDAEAALRKQLDDVEAEVKRLQAANEQLATQAKLVEAKRSQLAAENATLKRDLLEQQGKVSELTRTRVYLNYSNCISL